MDTSDIGMDRNPRALPARASAQAGMVAGALMAIAGSGLLAMSLSSTEFGTIGQDVPVWLVAGVVALGGFALAGCSMILWRRVQQRNSDRSRSQSR